MYMYILVHMEWCVCVCWGGSYAHSEAWLSPHPLLPSPTAPLTHSLLPSPTAPLTHSLLPSSHPLLPSPTAPLTHPPLTHCSPHPPLPSLTPSLPHSHTETAVTITWIQRVKFRKGLSLNLKRSLRCRLCTRPQTRLKTLLSTTSCLTMLCQ